jgi:hypothetical protein
MLSIIIVLKSKKINSIRILFFFVFFLRKNCPEKLKKKRLFQWLGSGIYFEWAGMVWVNPNGYGEIYYFKGFLEMPGNLKRQKRAKGNKFSPVSFLFNAFMVK